MIKKTKSRLDTGLDSRKVINLILRKEKLVEEIQEQMINQILSQILLCQQKEMNLVMKINQLEDKFYQNPLLKRQSYLKLKKNQ